MVTIGIGLREINKIRSIHCLTHPVPYPDRFTIIYTNRYISVSRILFCLDNISRCGKFNNGSFCPINKL
jgi:hypothetical protein